MHAKGKFSKMKGDNCGIPIETANICHISPRPGVSNELLVTKVKTVS